MKKAEVLNDCIGHLGSDGRLYKAIIDALEEAINYTYCCEKLNVKKVISFEKWLKANYIKKDNIYLSKEAESAWYTIREVKKQYNIEFSL